ncbi:hypothetical protein C1H46_013216 [Malus baccata]|uniref:Uncharacterized protein n=1 Tax=Malus baccata TaxID=106549 RepID=A0A540MSI7_MALBA|nr:hypothetical protein C1H46_013216 [Malus baccata]
MVPKRRKAHIAKTSPLQQFSPILQHAYRILPSKALPGASLSSVGDTQMQEEETPENGNGGSGGSQTHLCWTGASAAQLGWAVMSSRKGCAGNSFTMPLKAFAVASLYVGSIAPRASLASARRRIS